MVVCVWAGLVVGLRAVSLLLGEEFSPVTVDVVGVMREFAGTDPQLYSGTYTSQYCLSTWIRFESSLPASTVKPVTMLTAGKVNLGMEIYSSGSIVAYSDLVEGTSVSTTGLTGLSPDIWRLIAVCACNSLISVHTALYKTAASTNSSPITGTLIEYDPINSRIKTYGDGVTALGTAKMLAVRVTLDTCLTTGILTSQATACSPYCESCLGPAFPACAEYVQLLSPFTPTDLSTMKRIAGDDLSFEGRDYTGMDIAVTGWYQSSNFLTLKLFSVENQDYATSTMPTGCSVLSEEIEIGTTFHGQVDTASTPKVKTTDTLFTSSFPNRGWFFFVGSNCAGNSVFTCYATFSSTTPSPPPCLTTDLTSATFPFIRTSAASIQIGNLHIGGVAGATGLDLRYYPNRCLSGIAFQTMVARKKTACILGCNVCSSPNECSTCADGYYLDVSTCKRCNSCCEVCIGPNYTDCSRCANPCTMYGTSTCLGRRKSQCLTCRSGLFLQPHNSGLCLSTCPSGYKINIDRCVGSESLVLSLTFKTILPWFQDDTGNFLALNGLTDAYMPESELSDPLPYKNRGYYFAAGKLVQLPPHPRSFPDAPLSFNVEFTMEVWVRKLASGVLQPIYWKSGSLPIVTLYIDSNEKLGFKGGWPPTSLQSSGTVGYDQWTRLILIAKFSNTLGETTLTFIIDSLSSTVSGEFYIQDLDQSYSQTIGSTFDQTKSFTGFIWSLKVWNYALDPTTTAAAYTPNTPASGILLSTCGTAAEPDLCGACPVACTNGCVRTSDCGLCANRRCVLCDNFNTLECFSCIEHADIGPYKFCDCRPGRFFNEITVTCDLCDSQCMKCADAQPAKCLKCYPGAELISGSGSGCVCGESYYPNPTPSSCSPCPSSCLACTSPLVCTGCWSKASLQGSSCVCNAQHYPAPDASNCLQCAANCQRCDSSGCLQCISGRYLESGICVLICDSSYTPDPAAMVCTYNPSSQTPPYASMHISSSTLITISFTKELVERLSNSDLGMILTDTEGFEYVVRWTVGMQVNGSTYPVSISVNATYLPSENDFTVFFPNQVKMVDISGLSLGTTELNGDLPGFGSLSESSPASSSAFSTSKAMAGGSLASSLVLSLISGNPGTMWSLMNGMALLSYSSCMKLNTSQAQTDFFSSLNVQSFVPNPFKYILPEPEEGDAPGYGGFETSLFLHNAGVMFTVGVSLLIYWPFVALMARFPIRLIALYYSHLLEAFRWNILLRYWTQIYLDVAIASFLQLSHISFSTLATSLNSLLGLGFAVAFGLTPALIVWLVLNLTSETSGKFVFPSRFSMIFSEFEKEKGRSRMLFYPIFFFERLVIAGALIFLRTWPIAQVSFCLFSTIIVITTQMIVYQFIYKPYVDVIDGLCSFTTEACTVLVYLILAVYLWPLDSSSQSFYEVLLMAVVLITVGIMTLLSAYKLIVSLKRLLMEYRKELKKSVRPIVRAVRTFKTANQTSIHIEAQAKPSAFHLGH